MKKLLQQQGYSIIELMIALLLGSILLLGVTQVMISSSTLGTTSQNLIANQDVGKTVLELMGGDARRAGYNGCIKAEDGMIDIVTPGLGGSRPYAVEVSVNGGLSVAFRYGIDANLTHGIQDFNSLLTGKDCLGRKLIYRSAVYKNCTSEGKSAICVKVTSNFKEEGGNPSSIIENVSFNKVVFTTYNPEQKQGNKLITITSQTSINDSMLELINKYAKAVTFYITVKSVEITGTDKSKNQVERNYSASYTLRNL